MQKDNRTAKKLTSSIVVIILLAICFAVTTFALGFSIVSVEDNIFETGTVRINLNNGHPIISENEFLFEPGMTVKKDFFVKNESTCDIYYKLYFDNTDGMLSDVLQVKICDGDKVLFSGTPSQLSRKNTVAADDVLKLNEKRELQIYFHFPKEIGSAAQGQFLTFDFSADAVQVKNNTDKSFD